MINEFVGRRTIEELTTLYAVEPGLRDVVLEGRSDAAALSWYTKLHGIKCKVYAIDDRVEVPSGLVHEYLLDVGARGRVIALARKLDDRGSNKSLTCIADADLDHILGDPSPHCPMLLFTDFAAFEGYALDSHVVEKFLRLVLAAPTTTGDELLAGVLPALSQIFLVRAALKIVTPADALVNRFERCLKKTNSGIMVDVDELIRRSVADPEVATKVKNQYEIFREQLPEDLRKAARGHDIARVMIYWLGATGVFANHEAFERALMGCLERSLLDSFPLFEVLRKRLTSA